ncbi:MAG: outer membrane lipoprotein-sorting protein [Candidatus Cloacimonetes bacterium]|nr:outer membrane lipoprotein-sorting protein [Candidatus Cloacimonadota bacterium]
MKIKSLIIILFTVSLLSAADDFEEFKLQEKQQFEGSIIFDEMAKKIGNVEGINTIRTIGTVKQPVNYGSVSFPVQVDVDYSGKFRIKFEDKEFIIDNDKGWLKYPQGFYESLPDKYLNSIRGNLNKNLIYIIKSKNDFEIKSLGKKTILERDCFTMELVKEDIKLLLFVDTEKYLPVQMRYFVRAKEVVRTFLEYKNFAGINYPIHTISTDIENELISEIKIETIEFNIKIDDK